MAASILSGSPKNRLQPQLARDAIHLAECIERSVIERRTVDV